MLFTEYIKDMKVLIINLEQSIERLAQQERQFKQLGLSFERLPAVSIDDFNDTEYHRLAFSGQRPLKKAELACFLSHKKAWEYVITANEPCAILEDDAVLVKDFVHILSELEQQDIDFVNLEVHGRKKIVSSTEHFSIVNKQYNLLRLFLDRSGTGGYVIYPSGAKILLDYMQQRPIGLADEFIHSCNALNRYQIEPAALLQSDQCKQHNVPCDTVLNSVIAQVSSSVKTTYGLNLKEKFVFKIRRILRQTVLGYHLIKFRTKGERRYIKVDQNRF